MFNLGLKLWSTNENYIEEAKRLFAKGVYAYIELYVVPHSLDKIGLWTELKDINNIPFIIHAPHFKDGVNLAKKECKSWNMLLVNESIKFANILNSKYIIFHPGIAGEIKETVNEFNEINDDRILVENKPYFIEKDDSICNGATIDEIKFVLENTNVGFCLDIGHALCAANALKIEPIKYIKDFLKLQPKMFHLTDNKIDSIYDKHLHFGKGNIPLKEILSLLQKDSFITIETYKDFEDNLSDFERDEEYINGL